MQVNDPSVRNSQEAFMMETRAARMVRAIECIAKDTAFYGFYALKFSLQFKPHRMYN
jgi:hypothetical protein